MRDHRTRIAHSFVVPHIIAVALAVATTSLMIAAGCTRGTPSSTAVRTATIVGDFVGSDACAQCHPAEFRDHRRTRHAATMRAADRQTLGGLAPLPGIVPFAGFALEDRDGSLAFTRQIPSPQTEPLHLTLGSGKTGMTYVSILTDQTILEGRMSYFPQWHQWDFTPGQERQVEGDNVFGRPYDPAGSRRCLGCHATTLPAHTIVVDHRLYGVGCESCHGPGRAHIEAVQAGSRSDLRMEPLGTWSPDRLNEMCGRCHRTAKSINMQSSAMLETHRFQPMALTRSACRTANGEVLSCLKCHDPHADASKDKRHYEAVCLQCHAAPRPELVSGPSSAHAGKACPVNATSGCIGCHMSPVKAFPQEFVSAMLTNHLIAIPRKTRRAEEKARNSG